MIQDLICPLLSGFREGLIPHYPCIHRQAHMHICTNGHMPPREHKETGHIHVHMSTDTQRERQRDTHRETKTESRDRVRTETQGEMDMESQSSSRTLQLKLQLQLSSTRGQQATFSIKDLGRI